MAFITRCSMLKLHETCVILPITSQVRWKKEPKRKPRWLPMARSKVFRIPQHPYVPPDEKELILSLVEEYNNKFESLRAMYIDEVAQKSKDEGRSIEHERYEEDRFRMLLEENQKENERVKKIREEMLEKLFQENKQSLLKQFEDQKAKEEEIGKRLDVRVKIEKEQYESHITLENLDEVIEKVLDNPVNVNFAIDLNGGIKWEGKPPLKLEEELNRNIKRSMQT